MKFKLFSCDESSQNLRNGMNETVVIILFSTIINTISIYLYCHHGKCATDYYESYADCLYESNWIILPNRLRKSFILMIAYGQKEIFYDSYGFIKLDLEGFSKVCLLSKETKSIYF